MIILFFHVLFILNNLLKKKPDRADMSEENLVISTESIKENEATTEFDIENSFFDDRNPQIRFNPPLYIQRYCEVQKILGDEKFKGKLRKVVEFGCSELSFFLYLKHTPSLEELVFVDVDREVLEANKRKIVALSADFLHMRDRPLNVFVYEGSVGSKDRRLADTDAVVAIELIEHLYPETLEKVPEVIFGVMKPQVAVITTPNADFNVLFPNFSGSRHPDHKFEWSRKEFQAWCFQVTSRFPNYEVAFSGVGDAPPGSEHLGTCSQVGIFTAKEFVPGDDVPPGADLEDVFRLVAEEHYPVRVDNRSDEDKILDEASYFIRSFHLNNDEDEMPLKRLAGIMETSPETLKDVLEAGGWEVLERDPGAWFVVCKPLSVVSEFDAEENLDWDMDVEDDADVTSWGIDSGQNWEAEDWKPGPGPRCDWQPIPGAEHQEAASPKMTLDLEPDSGYPYTSSMPDVTPESELPSIADDLEEVPRVVDVQVDPPVRIPAVGQVENGDLANNNRDCEGNNVVAQHAVGDLENENFV